MKIYLLVIVCGSLNGLDSLFKSKQHFVMLATKLTLNTMYFYEYVAYDSYFYHSSDFWHQIWKLLLEIILKKLSHTRNTMKFPIKIPGGKLLLDFGPRGMLPVGQNPSANAFHGELFLREILPMGNISHYHVFQCLLSMMANHGKMP